MDMLRKLGSVAAGILFYFILLTVPTFPSLAAVSTPFVDAPSEYSSAVIAATTAPATVAAYSPDSADHFVITVDGNQNTTQTAGTVMQLVITAYNSDNTVAAGYSGSKEVTFGGASTIGSRVPTVTDKDSNARNFNTGIPIEFSNGVSVAGGAAVLYRTEITTITATSSTGIVTSIPLQVVVRPAAAAAFTVTGISATAMAGTACGYSVTAKDAYGNTASGYTGSVSFSSSDPYPAVLPSDYTYQASDSGSHTFSAVLYGSGSHSITVTDTADSSINGSLSGIAVNPAAASRLVFTAGSGQKLNSAQISDAITVRREDPYGNPTTSGFINISLETSSGSGKFYINPGRFIETNGTAICQGFSVTEPFYYTDADTGTVMLKVSSNGFTDAVTSFTINQTASGSGEDGGTGDGDSNAPDLIIPVVLTNFTSNSEISLNPQGQTLEDIHLEAKEMNCACDIPAGTYLLYANRDPLTGLNVAAPSTMPEPPSRAIVLTAYDFGPEGAIFDPYITLYFSFDPAGLPDGITPEQMTIGTCQDGIWDILESKLDTRTSTISCQVSHFTTYAVLSPKPAITTSVPSVITTGVTATPEPPAAISTTTALSSPSFTVSGLKLSPSVAKTGQEVTVSALVNNTDGRTDSCEVTLKLNGQVQSTKEVTLSGKTKEIVAFTLTEDRPGTYEIAVNELTGTLTVVIPSLSWIIAAVAGGIAAMLLSAAICIFRLKRSQHRV